MHRLSTGPAVWIGWLVARLILAWLVVGTEAPRGDVHYYHLGVFGDDPTALTEYPDAGLWPVRLLALFTGSDLDVFLPGFVLSCLLLDAVVLGLLLRSGGPRRFTAAWFWVAFGVAVGPVFVLRLDLWPAALVGASAALLARHPRWAAAALALATAMKLWPGVLAAGLVGGWRRTGTWLRTGWFAGTLVLLCLVTVVTSGLDRLLSPLTYQGDRGLQVESLTATPFVVAAHLSPERWPIDYSSSKSYEISGPGTDAAAALSSWLMVAVVLFALGWTVRALVVDRWRPRTTVAFSVLLVCLLIVANKVFSPQYIVWLGPLLAVGLCLTSSRLVRVMAGLIVLTAALGTVVFPFLYDSLTHTTGDALAAVIVLVVRNLLVLVVCGLAAAWLWREERRSGQQAGVDAHREVTASGSDGAGVASAS